MKTPILQALLMSPQNGAIRTPDGRYDAAVDSVRPILLKNNLDKMIWGFFAFILGQELVEWATKVQRGFVPRRIPLEGVIEIDTAARIKDTGVIAPIDFSAAFPSLSQEWLRICMEKAFASAWARHLAQATVEGSKVLRADGSIAFHIKAGVGQGDPAAAGLFVIGIDPLLRQLVSCFCSPEAVSAFADDIAVCTGSTNKLPLLAEVLKGFEKVSSLKINARKTILIPISAKPFETAAAEVKEAIAV